MSDHPFLSIDLMRGPGGDTTSCGVLSLGGAHALEPIGTDALTGQSYPGGHDWIDVSIIARRCLTLTQIDRAARLLIAQLGLAGPVLLEPRAQEQHAQAKREQRARQLALSRSRIWWP